MTTNDPSDAIHTDRSATPIIGAAGDPIRPAAGGGALSQLDDATIDRIAANLYAAIPGSPIPAIDVPYLPRSETPTPGPLTPGALSPTTTAAASTGAGTPPPGTAFSGIPGVVVPGAAFPGIPAVSPPAIAVPQASRADTAPALRTEGLLPDAASVPAIGAIPTSALPLLNFGGLDVPVPHLFDATPGWPTTPSITAPAYYFLEPERPARPAGSAPLLQRRSFDVRDIRHDFPILQERVHGRQLVWLDNAATTQKPRAVIDRIVRYYEHEYSNVHRAAHTLAARSTDAYEGARAKVQRFLGAGSASEIVFVRGTTEAVNLVANSWGRQHVGEGDEIVLSTLEHHSNIVPWQFLAAAVGARLRVIPVTDRGEVQLDEYGKLLGGRTRLVAITHVSNALGTVLPVAEMVQMAHRHGARVLVDGAQAVSHFPVNVQALDADFYVLSGHKVFGPSGVGVLYGKQALLDDMPPWQGGGNMIQHVTFEKSTFAEPPARFEAGTASLAPAVGLGAAIDYLEQIGMQNVARHEHDLLVCASEALGRIPEVKLIGTAPEKAGVVSFLVDGISAEEMGSYLDQEGIAVRAGHHCAQPTMDRFGVPSTVRASLALYNSFEDIDRLVRAVHKAVGR